MKNFFHIIIRYPWRFLAGALVVSILATWSTTHIPLLTSRRALLPKNLDVAQRLESYMARFGSATDLMLAVEQCPRNELEDFVGELALRLNKREEISSAIERIDVEFFLEHAFLMVPPSALEQFASVLDKLVSTPPDKAFCDWDDALGRAADWVAEPPEIANLDIKLKTAEQGLRLVNFFASEWLKWIKEPQTPNSVAWNELLAGQGAKSLAQGYFATHDGNMLFVLVQPQDPSEEFKPVHAFIQSVQEEVDQLSKEWDLQGRIVPKVGFTGVPAVTHEEFIALHQDIALIMVTAIVLIALIILLWLKSVQWAIVVFIPMCLGVLWNVGLSYFLVGHLTILTSGFIAILFGLGVDYGIFMSSRVIEELRKGVKLCDAIPRGATASLRALVMAAGATAGIFFALCASDFPGFVELGIVAGVGVLIVLASTILVQPALFVLLPPKIRSTQSTRMPSSPEQGGMLTLTKKTSKRVSSIILGLSVVFVCAGVVGGLHISFNYDVLALLPPDSEAVYYQRKMVEESDFQSEVVIYTASSIEEARSITDAAKGLPTISRVESIVDLFPIDVQARVQKAHAIGAIVEDSETVKQILRLGEVHLSSATVENIRQSLKNIQELLEEAEEYAFSAGHVELIKEIDQFLQTIEKIDSRILEKPEHSRKRTENYVYQLWKAAEKGLSVLASWKDAHKIEPLELPKMLRDRFFASDGTMAVYAFPARSIYDEDFIDSLIEQVYSVSPKATGMPTTHAVFSKLVVKAFTRGTILAVLVALVWISLVVRSVQGVILAALPLLVGGSWMMGLMKLMGLPFNYASVISLPLVMGLAVDYGVWFVNRRREIRDVSSWKVSKIAGQAILLAAATTLAGLGAITLASYQGVSLMGKSLTIGLVCCVVAALVVSPAIADLLFRSKKL